MTQPFGNLKNDFYLTAPAPCPYLPGQQERKIFSFLSGADAPQTNSDLTQRGFRRSQNIVYVPACDACKACTPVRVEVEKYVASRSARRITKRNAHVSRVVRAPKATATQFSVLRGYLDARHAGGGMADMTVLDYTAMVEQTAVDTMLIEYWADHGTDDAQLLGCALSDRLQDGFSMVYSFFEPEAEKLSLGTYMIQDHIAFAAQLNLPYVYLGYWVQGSPKMDYKRNFEPLQKLTPAGWQPFPSVRNGPPA